jgi:hypothetical protein
VNVGSQPYIFTNPLDHAHLRHFSPPILLVPIVGHDHTPQPTLISLTRPQPPPKIMCSTYGRQFTCRNPHPGLMTKANACKGAGQEGCSKVTSHAPENAKECEEMNFHTPK